MLLLVTFQIPLGMVGNLLVYHTRPGKSRLPVVEVGPKLGEGFFNWRSCVLLGPKRSANGTANGWTVGRSNSYCTPRIVERVLPSMLLSCTGKASLMTERWSMLAMVKSRPKIYR